MMIQIIHCVNGSFVDCFGPPLMMAFLVYPTWHTQFEHMQCDSLCFVCYLLLHLIEAQIPVLCNSKTIDESRHQTHIVRINRCFIAMHGHVMRHAPHTCTKFIK
eukprot:338767_1